MLLHRHFAKINLDPKFRAADEHELNIFKQEIVEEVFEQHYAASDEAVRKKFQRFTDEFGGNEHGDSALHELVIELYDTAQSHPDPKAWLLSLPSDFDIAEDGSLEQTRWYSEACKQILFELDAAVGECELVQSLFAKDIPKCLLDDAELLDEFKRAFQADWQRLFKLINSKSFVRLNLRGVEPELKDQVRSLRDNGYKKRIAELKKQYFFAPPERLLEDLRAVRPSIEMLVRVTLAFADAYAAAKRDKCIIDFSDMEHFALNILDDHSIANALRKKYKTVMIDEYQDTNEVQEAILQSISDGENLFVVGDVKQSIYRFRLADPTLFMKKYEEYPKREDCQRIELSMSFRSRSEVIDAVNFVFERLMQKDAVEIDYTDDARLNCGAEYPAVDGKMLDTPTEFLLVSTDKNSFDIKLEDDGGIVKTNADFSPRDASADKIKASRIELETQLIAERIKQLIAEGTLVFDKELKAYRPIQYRDIVILLRSAAKSTGAILDVLKKNGIDAYSADESTYFRATEIQVIVSLLTVLDNARQDIPMAAVLLSPLGKFTADELAQLKIISPNDDLYTLLTLSAAEGNPKAVDFIRNLKQWRDMSMTMSVPELLSTIYRQTKYYEAVAAMNDGRQRQANLRMLIDRAATYEQTSFRGLSRFLQFIKKIRELDNDLKSARTLGENENVVRIMTVHKSKGLEFPVVFVADLGHKFNVKDETAKSLLTHKEFGAGPYRMLENLPIKIPTLARRVIAKRGLNELLAEELRILYVAMTRAREKLILVGSVERGGSEKYRHFEHFNRLPGFAVLDARSFLDWIMLALTRRTRSIEQKIVDAKTIKIGEGETPVVEEKKIRAELPDTSTEQTVNIPAKMSVTELKRRFGEDELTVNVMREEQQYRRPNFEQEKRLTGAEYGIAMHSVMQHLNLRGDLSMRGISDQIANMVERKILSPEQAQSIRRKNIATFFESDFGRRLLRAEKVYRELPFGFLVASSEINELLAAKALPGVRDRIFIQGIIDVLFRDVGGLILLDYKTDRIADSEVVRRKYQLQLELYAKAVESILHERVSEKHIFMLSTGALIDI